MPRGVYPRTKRHIAAIKRGLQHRKSAKPNGSSPAISYQLSAIQDTPPKRDKPPVTYSRSEKRVEGTVVEVDEKAGEIKLAMGNARVLIRTR
jgi:hypothetical protein